MKTHKISTAKITRPVATGVVRRNRLFSLLDSQTGKPVTWISAPGGSGKSTLVASYLDERQLPCIWYHCNEEDADLATFFYYMGLATRQTSPRSRKHLPLLTPEYIAGIPAFTRRFFEALYRRLTPPRPMGGQHIGCVIVLDNFQDVPADSSFHDILSIGFEGIPDGIRIMIMSREEPPASLARQFANGRIGTLTFDDIRFTLDESRDLIESRRAALDPDRIPMVHERTEGWVAGMVLMLDRPTLERTAGESCTELPSEQLFDYFAAEVFSRLEQEVRDFLLTTALPPTLTVQTAQRLTSSKNAGQILSMLSRRHFFTDRLTGGDDQEYKYHPLFREFLLNMAKTVFPPQKLIEAQRKAALLLEQSGNIEDAAGLFCNAGDFAGIGRIVKAHGRDLLMQGRNRKLQEWLSCIPADYLDDDPWLLYWQGVSAFPLDLPRTRQYLERALEALKVIRDHSGIYLSWAGIVDSYAFSEGWRYLDGCIADFEALRERYPTFSSVQDELVASSRILLCLTLRRTDQPKLVQSWLQRVSALLHEKPSIDIRMDTVFCMSVYYLWTGEYYKNTILLDRAKAELRHHQTSPFTAVRIKLMTGIQNWVAADYDSAVQTLTEGLKLSATYGVHLYDSLLWSFRAASEMAAGSLAEARQSLEQQMKSLLGMENPLNLFFYHINSAWHALLVHNLPRGEEHLETVFPDMELMGTPYYRALWHLGMAQMKFLQGRNDDAKAHLHTAHRVSLSMKSQVMEWYSLLIEAWFQLEEGKEPEGLLSLHRGLSLGKSKGYVHLEFYQPAVMRFLSARALAERIEPEYVQQLIRKLNLTPPAQEPKAGLSVTCLEEWPYPLKIYTLGRFEILKSDEPLRFTGKEQKKPLEMLKVLIAYGGRNLPREQVTDILWPDADGDQASKSFETTLGRLRKLVGGDHFVIYQARQLTLNRDYCWVDSLSLNDLFDALQDAPPDQWMQLCDRVINMHQGPFLETEGVVGWVVSRRETQLNRLLRIIGTVGHYHEQRGEWELAADYFLKAITADDLAEEFYRRLMICYRHLGNKAAAVRTYHRCRDRLKADLGIAPSKETTSVYSTLMQQL